MRRAPRLACFIALASTAGACFGKEMPSERELLTRFPERRAALESLRAMSDVDRRVIRVARDFTRLDSSWAWPRPDSLLGFSRPRWDHYRALFDRVGSEDGLERGDSGAILVIERATGLTLRGVERGYAYLPAPPGPRELVSSLDSSRGVGVTYRRVEPPWYIYERDR